MKITQILQVFLFPKLKFIISKLTSEALACLEKQMNIVYLYELDNKLNSPKSPKRKFRKWLEVKVKKLGWFNNYYIIILL